jgi:sugar phosphate isomerase/epimerase
VFAVLEERGYRGWIGIEPVDERNAREELADAMTHLAAL